VKIAYFDCFSGASGDMILGALLDAGFAEGKLREQLAALHQGDIHLQVRRVQRGGLSATQVQIAIEQHQPERRLAEIEAIIQGSDLPRSIQNRALNIFHRLAQVEGHIHGLLPEQVHFHELGGLDTIIDVVGGLAGLNELGVEQVIVSPLPLGRGFVDTRHGPLPLPAPATLALLQDVPLVGSELQVELVTPTGAALLTDLAASFGPIPAMRIERVGYGAGSRDLPIPNVLRILVGETPGPKDSQVETLVQLETNIDDLNPQFYDYVMARLFAAGALDITLSPILMKKNRPATLLQVLCAPGDSDALMAILFAETSTLGIRKQIVERQALARAIWEVRTPYGPLRVKIAQIASGGYKAAPEYEDCARLALEKNVPLRQVYQAAEQAIQDLLARNPFTP